MRQTSRLLRRGYSLGLRAMLVDPTIQKVQPQNARQSRKWKASLCPPNESQCIARRGVIRAMGHQTHLNGAAPDARRRRRFYPGGRDRAKALWWIGLYIRERRAQAATA